MFEWLNDPLTRAMSLSTKPVPYADHCAWFRAALADPGRHLFIAELAGQPFAFLRLDGRPDEGTSREGPSCTISINLAPRSRARGLGTACLQAMSGEAASLGFSQVDASIREDNAASLRAFAKVGYVERAREDGVVRCRLSLAPRSDHTG